MFEAPIETRSIGTVAIVTGASRGVGRELVLELTSRGCAVVVVYLRDQAAAQAVVEDANSAGGTALTVRADFTDDLDVERLFDETDFALGLVDIVVHTARAAAQELIAQSVRRLRRGGVILSIPAPGVAARALAEEIRVSGVTVSGLTQGLASSGSDHDVRDLIERLLPWLDAAERLDVR